MFKSPELLNWGKFRYLGSRKYQNKVKRSLEQDEPKSACGKPGVYLFPVVAIAEDHNLGGGNSRNITSRGSGGWKCEIKVSGATLPRQALGENLFQAPLPAFLGL